MKKHYIVETVCPNRRVVVATKQRAGELIAEHMKVYNYDTFNDGEMACAEDKKLMQEFLEGVVIDGMTVDSAMLYCADVNPIDVEG